MPPITIVRSASAATTPAASAPYSAARARVTPGPTIASAGRTGFRPPGAGFSREPERRPRPVGGRVARPARLAPPGRRQEDAAQVERADQAVVDDRVHVVEQQRAAERVRVAAERDQRDGGEQPAARGRPRRAARAPARGATRGTCPVP